MRRPLTVIALLCACLAGGIVASAAAATTKSCGSVQVPKAGNGVPRTLEVRVLKGSASCATAKSVFEKFYSTRAKAGVRKIEGFSCAGGAPPQARITCRNKKGELEAEA